MVNYSGCKCICLMIAAVASASGSASASSSTSVARSTAVSTKETTTTESKVVQLMMLVALIVFMAFKMSLMTLLTMMTMMALKILFNVADLPRAGFEGTVRVDRIREEIGQYSWPYRPIVLVFTEDVQLQKSLKMKKIFACRNPKPSVARRCTLPAVERTQGIQFCQGEQNVCFCLCLGLGLGKVRGMFCFGVSLSLGLGLSFAKVWKSFGHSLRVFL